MTDWIYQNIDMSNDTNRVLVTGTMLIILGIIFWLFAELVKYLTKKSIERQLEEYYNTPPCDHNFECLDETLAHEPFCTKCKKGLNQIMEDGE